jgi:hypothetical protein
MLKFVCDVCKGKISNLSRQCQIYFLLEIYTNGSMFDLIQLLNLI